MLGFEFRVTMRSRICGFLDSSQLQIGRICPPAMLVSIDRRLAVMNGNTVAVRSCRNPSPYLVRQPTALVPHSLEPCDEVLVRVTKDSNEDTATALNRILRRRSPQPPW